MHIPDGYLSPQTYLPAYAVMSALWAWASRRVGQTLRLRQVPLLALGAAFSFVIMMFNVPAPGGTTGHAVGAVLIAILLGPWEAVIAVSLALIVQALLFGDGGITAAGANCFTMAVVMSFTGWWAYRLIAGRAPSLRRQVVAGAVGGYVGLNAAALATAVMLGIQPLIAHASGGAALYNPFSLQITVPVMMAEHLLLFGFVEAAVTGLVLAYVARIEPSLLPGATSGRPLLHRLGIALVVLIVLTPLGLYLPRLFHAGGAWGEWGAQDVPAQITRETGGPGYLPHGLEHLSRLWKAPLAGYGLPGQEGAPLWQLSLVYAGTALLGVLILVLLLLGLRRLARRRAGGHGLARRTLNSLARLLAAMVGDESLAAKSGLLQRIEPRAKVLGLVGLVVAATLVHELPALGLLFGLCLLLALASGIPARRFAGAWLAAPLLSALIILPATLNVITPGHVVWHLGQVGPWRLAVTTPGLLVAARFVLRVAVCVSLALLLAVTTRPARLFRGLRALGVPKIFVMLLLMMERYLAVIVRAAEEIHEAKLSRSLAPGSLRQEQAWVAAGMGSLFRRAEKLGNAVHLAMISRGYTGDIYLLDEPRWTAREWAFLAALLLVVAGLLIMR